MNDKNVYFAIGLVFSLMFFLGAKDIPLIEPQVQNGIEFVSGGIGKGEREAMTEAFTAEDYNLKLIFAAQTGQYLSFIPVRIADSAGRVLIETDSTGPWFFANLPPGQYRVTAVYGGQEKTREVTVNESMNTARFSWKYQGELQTRTEDSGAAARGFQPQEAPQGKP